MKPEIQKLLWRSRRGMLELDALFRRYLMDKGDGLSPQQLQEFEALLQYQDQELFDAFSGKVPLDDEKLNVLFNELKL